MMRSRQEMLITTSDHGGHQAGFCACCGAKGWMSRLEHHFDCPLKSESVTHVAMSGCKAVVVLRRRRGRYHWNGPTGRAYRIRRVAPFWCLETFSGQREIVSLLRLRDIREYIKDNQGTL